MDCRLLSLDTSSTASGWALFENAKLTSSGTCAVNKKLDAEDRLSRMIHSLLDILNEYKPDIVVIEMTVVNRGTGTQRLLSEIVGAVRGWACAFDAEFVEYRPTVWRKLIVGPSGKIPIKRDNCKAWSMDLVNKYRAVYDDNESDAILIGFARIIDMLGGTVQEWFKEDEREKTA